MSDYCCIANESGIITGIEFLHMKNIKQTVSPCLELYKREFLINNEIFFRENAYFEDNPFSLWVHMLANRMKIITDIAYFYRENPNSTTTTYWGGRKVADIFGYCIDCIMLCEKYTRCFDVKEYYIEYLKNDPDKFKRRILFFPLKEKYLFYKQIKIYNRGALSKYLSFQNRFIIQFPFFFFLFSIVPSILYKAINKCINKL